MGETIQGRPIKIEPNPNARTRWDYYRAIRANEDIELASRSPFGVAKKLAEYVFDTHPHVPDFASGISYRFGQAQKVIEQYPKGSEILRDVILNDFQETEGRFQDGYTYAVSPTIISSHPDIPRRISHGGHFVQKIQLPESVQRRSLAWNRWAQNIIENGDMKKLFSESPYFLGIEPARGTKLPAGNLVVEVGEGLGRVRTPIYRPHDLEKVWGLPVDNEWGSGLDLWFIMTHIMEKDMLNLAETLGEDMIDGRKLTPEVYVKSYVPILQLIDLNPQLPIQGVLSDASWIYSPELMSLFPQQAVASLHSIAGNVIDLGPALELGLPEQVGFSTKDSTRRKAFLEGQYEANVAARFIGPSEMRNIVRRFGLTA